MVRMTEQEYLALLARRMRKVGKLKNPTEPAPVKVIPKPKPDRLNKMESAFAQYLMQHTGYLVLAQQIKLRLADKTWYTPDFVCFCMDGVVRIYETKGFMRDDAAVKLKVAAEQYWFFQWHLVTRKKGEWIIKPTTKLWTKSTKS